MIKKSLMSFTNKKVRAYKIFNAGLRIFPLGLKFILFTVLSKYLKIEVYGDYSLITTTVTISIFILGLDFYNFSIRNILTERESVPEKLFSSLFIYILAYSCFALIGVFFFEKVDFLSKNGIYLVILLCITEHLTQEIYRFHIAFKKVLLGNFVFFIRVVGWTGYLLVQTLIFNIIPSISFILKLWISFNFIALMISCFAEWKEFLKIKHLPKIDFSFIGKGLKISSLFFLGTISLKSIEYINRYLVDFFLGTEKTGIFSFYANLALIITVYINAIVISFELPSLIEKSNSPNLRKHFKKFKKRLLIQIMVISILVLLAIKPILIWQNIDIYNEYFPILLILLFGVALMNYSLTYHFYLYVKNKDKRILKITLKSGLINILLTIGLTYFFDLYGTSAAFLLTGLFMFYQRKREAIIEKYG